MSRLKRILLLTIFSLALSAGRAQNPGRIFRTEVTPYSNRAEAVKHAKDDSDLKISFRPTATRQGAAQSLELPLKWFSGDVYLHLENVPAMYCLTVNGQKVATVEDLTTAADFRITRALKNGLNEIRLEFVDAGRRMLSPHCPAGKDFENSYLYAQDHRAVVDYEAEIIPDPEGRNFGIMKINAVVRNAYTTPEPVRVHFDLYDPAGKLVDHNNLTKVVAPKSIDTIRFKTFVYGSYNHKWMAGRTNPGLYKAMLFVNREGTYKEYMPFNLGFGKTEFTDGRITRFGEELVLKKAVCNATDRATTTLKLKTLKKQGINTITPDYPQPEWFYALCDELGLYVIDQADISIADKRNDRTVGGTPSNDPELVDEFVERVKAMYYRSRNHVCVIAYSLGAPSGNGYNMYKAYEWLKSVEKFRPVIYTDADGEWDSDL